MQVISVTRVLVWSRWLRLTHWTLALSTIGLLASGWLMSIDSPLVRDARDFHYLCSALLLPALTLRLLLLFLGKGSDHLSDCEPNRHRLNQAREVLRFYLTLGHTPLPKWYSHNPLWGPIYLVLFLLLITSSMSGLLLLKEMALFANISNYDLHQISYYAIGLFTALHLPAVFSHDLSGKSADISGMINGYRTFQIKKPEPQDETRTPSISLETLLNSKK